MSFNDLIKKGTHQADAVIRAFRYQIDQSLLAWLELQPQEKLWLEVSEDFTRASPRTVIDVQVKSSTARELPGYSLRSPEVQTTMRRYWQRSNGGADAAQRVVFLAHGHVAHERYAAFPGGEPGLLYWRQAAFESDTAELRRVLLDIFESDALGVWLATNPTDDELRGRLLGRITWALDAPKALQLEETIRDRSSGPFDREVPDRDGHGRYDQDLARHRGGDCEQARPRRTTPNSH